MMRFDSALAQIRARTRSLHKELEVLVARLELFDSRTGLRNHLATLLSHHVRAAQRTHDSPDIHAWIMERVDDLIHDLQVIPTEAPSPRGLRIPCDGSIETQQPSAFVRDGRGYSLGEVYVVEGSRLGAEVIAKKLKHNGVWEEGLRFASTSGAAVGARWRRVEDLLLSLNPNEWGNASTAAAESFRELLERYQLLTHEARKPQSAPLE